MLQEGRRERKRRGVRGVKGVVYICDALFHLDNDLLFSTRPSGCGVYFKGRLFTKFKHNFLLFIKISLFVDVFISIVWKNNKNK